MHSLNSPPTGTDERAKTIWGRVSEPYTLFPGAKLRVDTESVVLSARHQRQNFLISKAELYISSPSWPARSRCWTSLVPVSFWLPLVPLELRFSCDRLLRSSCCQQHRHNQEQLHSGTGWLDLAGRWPKAATLHSTPSQLKAYLPDFPGSFSATPTGRWR